MEKYAPNVLFTMKLCKLILSTNSQSSFSECLSSVQGQKLFWTSWECSQKDEDALNRGIEKKKTNAKIAEASDVVAQEMPQQKKNT